MWVYWAGGLLAGGWGAVAGSPTLPLRGAGVDRLRRRQQQQHGVMRGGVAAVVAGDAADEPGGVGGAAVAGGGQGVLGAVQVTGPDGVQTVREYD